MAVEIDLKYQFISILQLVISLKQLQTRSDKTSSNQLNIHVGCSIFTNPIHIRLAIES